MTGKAKYFYALGALYGLLGGVTALLYLVLWTALKPDEKAAILRILDARGGVAIFILLLAAIAIGMVFHALYQRYVTTPLRLREKLLVMLSPEQKIRLPLEGPPEMRALSDAINCLADQRDALQHDVQERIREANASVEEEKNRFAALVAELNQSVIVCNIDGRILLYNDRARTLFQSPGDNRPVSPGGSLIGLGRSIFSVLERGLINHALERIEQALAGGSQQPVAAFVTGTNSGQLLRTRVAPVFSGAPRQGDAITSQEERACSMSGYVLILDNITGSVDIEGRRDVMLQALTEGSRSSLASIRAAVENLLDYPDMDAGQRDRFIHVMRDEVCAMSERLDRTANEFSDVLKGHWPLEEMLGTDLVQAMQRRIEQRLALPTKAEDLAEGLWLKVDSFSLLQGITYLATRLKEEFQIREVRFRLAREGRLAHLDLIWSGVVIGTETLVNWEIEPMDTEANGPSLTLREIVERHGGELWFQRDKFSHKSFFRILIPTSAPPQPLLPPAPAGAGRPEYYDFDLFRQTEETRALDERLLSLLTYTVFDTETTGLDPAAGDEIIQIGATRIVNGRLLKNESFDQLIDPKRPIPAASRRIHGIDDSMLRGQPGIERVLPAFHDFCDDTVLVAHNAAFDMRFLQIKERPTGVAFRNPVLDTLLLSAVIHPHQESHSLEAIAERLGVSVMGRHTALGDAMVTGEVFLKMIPLLAEKGIKTLRDAREAAERTYYAKVKY